MGYVPTIVTCCRNVIFGTDGGSLRLKGYSNDPNMNRNNRQITAEVSHNRLKNAELLTY